MYFLELLGYFRSQAGTTCGFARNLEGRTDNTETVVTTMEVAPKKTRILLTNDDGLFD